MAAYRGKARYHLLSEMSWNSDATNSWRNTLSSSPVFWTSWPAIGETKPTSFALKYHWPGLFLAGEHGHTTPPLDLVLPFASIGSQCISRMQPGFTVTIADATFADAGKFLE